MKASVYIETSGCSFNASDSEVMAGVLEQSGYALAETAEAADLVLLNTCTVKDRTFRDFRKRLDQLTGVAEGRPARPLVVAGCVAKAYERSDLFDSVSTLGPDQVGRVGEVVRESLRGRVIHLLGRESSIRRPTLPVRRRNPLIEILPIARGCLSACAFCQTRVARGRLCSFTPGEVLAQARRALDQGIGEFWVTGQDAGAYGHDIGVPLPRLMRRLLALQGEFKVRLGMSSPRWIDERLDEYLDLFDDPKMFRFLHVPVQSGSDRVLRRMKRDGTVAQFERIHDTFTTQFPDSTVMTDVIAGYPAETEEDFGRTLALLERAQLPAVNCSKFSARPGTPAARLPQLHSSVISNRSRRLVNLVRAIAGEYHRKRVGRVVPVLIDQVNKDGSRLGRTESYRPVLVDDAVPLGSMQEVELIRGEPFRYFGRVVGATHGMSSHKEEFEK